MEAHADYLLGLIWREPDLTLAEICDRLKRVRGEQVSPSMIWRFFDRHDITLKKIARASEQDRPDILQRRREWFAGQLDLDPLKLVFVDETGAATNMARRYGRPWRGRRLRCGVPHGHYKAITFVCGLRLRGVVAPKAYGSRPERRDLRRPGSNTIFCRRWKRATSSSWTISTSTKAHGWLKFWRKRSCGSDICALQPRLQPHREGLFEAQIPPAKTR